MNVDALRSRVSALSREDSFFCCVQVYDNIYYVNPESDRGFQSQCLDLAAVVVISRIGKKKNDYYF